MIGLFNLTPKFRMGVGARYAAAAKFTSDGAGYVGNADFKSQLGGLVMAEWLITPSMGVQLRFVDEKYKVKRQTTPDRRQPRRPRLQLLLLTPGVRRRRFSVAR